MTNASLTALSPLDGRYYDKVDSLRTIFSEYGLIKFRVLIEVRWLECLTTANMAELPRLTKTSQHLLTDIVTNFSEQDAEHIKKIENTINHDVKAVEYFLKERTAKDKDLKKMNEFFHFGCTSEDINNLAYALALQTARKEILLPNLETLLKILKKLAKETAKQPMLARTHGQPASPTTIGKEFTNVVARLQRQIDQLISTPILGKLNGATGNYSAFAITYPNLDWQNISKNFVTALGLQWNPYTTQIEPHDYLAEFFAIIMRINTILLDLNRDMWGYIAIHYFKLKSIHTEVGSSTMPHKINPIDFENSEGNLGIANALLDFMAQKLPVSRWQRDLSDSTVLRNMGVAFGHTVLGWQATTKGLEKITPNIEVINADLDKHWEILAEPIQTIMRRFGIEEPYEKLKSFTRGQQISAEILRKFIDGLELPVDVKKQLLSLEPRDYVGYAEELANSLVD